MQILFITANRLGDAILSTGVMATLLERYPGAALTIACGPLPAPLFATVPNATIIPLVKAPYGGHWRHLWLATAGMHWDLIVDLRGSLVSRLLRARRRIIWHKPPLRLHKVEELASLINAEQPAAPRLWLASDIVEQARKRLPAGPILALAPGANSVGKRWPVERYFDLAAILTRPDGFLPNATILLLGDRQDYDLIAPHLNTVPPNTIINLVGEASIDFTAACLSLSTFYIGNDSGLTHLAAAAGVPTLALFGPGIAWKYRPWGAHAAYISKADDPARDHDLCRDGDDAAALALMERLSVQDVVAAATSLWQNLHP